MPELHLSKLDAALRQLETAITVYFHNADPVSIHTLTAASYNVFRSIKTHRGANFKMFKDAERVYPHMRKEFLKFLNDAENFFKHADRDPESTHAFNPVSSDFLLIDACEAYMRLTGERRPVLSTYMMWFWIRHPQYYEEVPTASFLKRQYREEQRLLFFREALPRASNPTA